MSRNAPSPGRATILVVDDEAPIREALAEGLEDAGFAVLTADSGLGALEIAKVQAVDAVVLDQRMPGMDGLATLAALKEADPDVEVVLLTAHATIETAVAAMKHHAYDYLTKPFDLGALTRLLSRAVAQRRLREELRAATARAEELEARYDELELVHRISELVTEAEDLDSALAAIARTAMEVGRFDVGAVCLVDPRGGRVTTSVEVGSDAAKTARGLYLHTADPSRLAKALAGRRAFVRTTPPGVPRPEEAIVWSVVVPVRHREAVIGVVELGSREGRPVSALELRMLDAIGSQVGVAFERARLTARARRADEERTVAELARERLAAVLEATPDLVAIADGAGRVLYLNAGGRRLLGLSPAEPIVGLSLADRRPAWSRSQMLDEAMPRAARDGLWAGEGVLLGPEGREVPVSQVLVGHRSASREVDFFSLVARDVAEHRQLEAQLRQSQKVEALGQLAGGVAHDFNNLLTAIRGCAELMLEELPSEESARGEAEEIRRAADRGAALTQQLLAFGRRQVLHMRVLDLNRVVENVEGLLRRLIGADVTLVARLAGDLHRVKADSSQLEQVLMNLAVNARDAMPHGGQLTIETANVLIDETYARTHVAARPGPHVLLAVTDTGSGMDANTTARIFEPFFTTKGVGKGTGLGLSTVYGIVKQSGGSIWVYSEPGHGTTFKIYLPSVDAAAQDGPPAPAPAAGVRGSETVLLVDDDDAVRFFVRRALETQGYTVLDANGGEEALQLASAHAGPIDLLLTDVIMPKMQGPELAQRITSARSGVRVLYMSGFTHGAPVTGNLLKAGAAFLAKPFGAAVLGEKIRELLSDPAG